MDIEQADIEKRYATTLAPGGWYYSTNTFFYDLDNPPTTNTSLYNIGIALRHGFTTAAQTTGAKRTKPPGSGIYTGGGFQPPDPNDIPFTGGYSITDIARLAFYASGRYVGYKLLRCPVPTDYQQDGLLTGLLKSQLENDTIPLLLFARITTRDGTPIDEIRLDPRVRNWGLRHGTKRRTGHVLSF